MSARDVNYGVRITADARGFVGQSGEAKRSVEDFGESAERASVIGAKLGTIVGTTLVASAVAFTAALRTSVAAIDDLDENAQAIGTTAVTLANLQRGAADAGFSAERLDQAMYRLSSRLTDAARGGKESTAIFNALAIQTHDTSGNLRGAVDVVKDLSDRFRSFRDGPEKSAIALELLGRAGPKAIAWMNQGGEALEKFSGLTDKTVEAATKLQTQIDKTAGHFERMKNAILGGVLPAINAFFEASAGTEENQPFKRLERINKQIEVLQHNIDTTPANRRGSELFRAWTDDLEQLRKKAEEAEGEIRRAFRAANVVQGDKAAAPIVPRDVKTPKVKEVDELAEAQMEALKQYAAQLAEAERIRAAVYQVTATMLEQQRRETAQLVEGNQQLREHNQEIGLSAEQVTRLRDARFDATIAQKEEALATAEAIGGQEAAIAVMKREIELLRERQGLLRQGVAREAAAEASRAATEEAKRMSQEIERSLTDALMRGFESGKDFAQKLRDTLFNLFQTLVLRPLIAPIVQSGANELTGLIRGFIGAWAGGGGSNYAPGESPTSFTGRASAGSTGAIAGDGLMRSSGARGMPGFQVNVHNYAGDDIQVRPGANGLSLDVIVKRATSLIAGDIARGRGDLGRAMEQTYGLQRKPA